MQYLKPFSFFISRPGSTTNLLSAAVCILIPIIGPIVLLGYRAEVAEDLDRDPDLEDYPDFQFDRFGDYLGLGFYPFLYQLIISLVGGGVAIVGGGGIGFAVYKLIDQEPGGMIAGIIVGFVIYMTVAIGIALVLWPMELHAQLTRRFAFFEALAFASRLLKRVWGQAIISVIVFYFLSVVIVIIGYLACIVGVYASIAIMFMAQQHYMAQLYRLYLEEGGEVIKQYNDDDDIEILDE
jgi:hypothetical protein